MSDQQLQTRRPIRSFVRRAGRMTKAQEAAIDRLWDEFGCEGPLGDLKNPFMREQPLVLEIGFGMGASFLAMAASRPDENYLGIEVHPPGVGTVLQGIAKQGLENIRVYRDDAKMVCRDWISDQSLSRIQIYFSDPWPKKRHHKRRLIQAEFIELLARKLKPGAYLHLVTDDQHYAEHMQDVVSAYPAFKRLNTIPYERPTTKYERFAFDKGHAIFDLFYQLK